jgi:hypothetical protein
LKILDPTVLQASFGLASPPEDWLAAADAYVDREYPAASNLDRRSFAGLVAYLATGFYGGYGTEDYEKERQIEDLALAFTGGLPAPPDGIVSFTPPLGPDGEPVKWLPEPEHTETLLRLIEIAYFQTDPREALEQAAAILHVDHPGGGREALTVRAREGLLRVFEKYFFSREVDR